MNSDMHNDSGHLTALGWTSFALYLVTALLAFRAAASVRGSPSSEISRVWFCLGVILAVLGLNKPLDFQTMLIRLGRFVAIKENLFEHRLQLHALSFLGFVLVIIALIIAARFRSPGRIGRVGRQLPLAAGGCALVCAYIVIRAASIGHIGQALGFDLEHIPFLWLLEAGGLLLIIVQALCKPTMKS